MSFVKISPCKKFAVFTINDEKLGKGRPGNKAIKEVVCTGYNTASCNHSYSLQVGKSHWGAKL